MRPRLRAMVAVALGLAVGAGGTLALQPPPVEQRAPAPSPVADPGSAPAPPVGEDRIVKKAPISTVLAWTPGRLPEGYATDVRGLRSVTAAAVVRSGTVWIDGWEGSDGVAEGPPPGFRIPVEVAAVRPGSYARFVPPAERPLVEGLADGGAVLARTAASLRGIAEGGSLRIDGRTLRVEGIVDDELIGAHEVAVSVATGEGLGVVTPRYLLVAPRPTTPRARIEEGLRRVLPSGVRLRVRGPGETPVFRHGDAVLPPLRLKELFGEFAARPAAGGMIVQDPDWVEEHILEARMPILGTVRCHRAVLPVLRRALGEVDRRGLGDLVDPGDYGGCFSPRFLNRDPQAGLSHHAWGIAIDLNVSGNRFGREPTMDRRVVEVFERQGFTWGGRWLVPDGMHFEFLRFPSGD